MAYAEKDQNDDIRAKVRGEREKGRDRASERAGVVRRDTGIGR